MTGALRRAARLEGADRRRFAVSVALAVGAVAAACALLATSGYLISRAAQRPPVLLLTATIVVVRALALARAGLRYGERLTSHDVALRRLTAIRVRLYRRLAPLVPGDLRGADRGELLSRFVGDVDTLQHLHPRVLTPPLVAAATVVGASAAAAAMVPAAGAVLAAALLAAAAAAIGLTAWAAGAAARAEADERATLARLVLEALDGGAELAVAGRARHHAARIEAAGARLAAIQRRYALGGAAASAASGLLTGAGLLGVLAVGVGAVRGGTLAGVLLAALALLAVAAAEGIAPLGPAARHLRACAVAAARVEAVCAPEPSVVDPPEPAATPGGGAVAARPAATHGEQPAGPRAAAALDGEQPAGPRAAAALDGSLALEDVHVRYGPGEPWVLRGVSLRIEPGERVALVGPSGAGKTTLAHLLVRFRDPDRGRVALGGVDVRELRQRDLRQVVALVDQDAHLFTTTVRENVRLARPGATDAEVARALGAAGLEPWLAALPDGLDTILGEDGTTVSGGERRRLAVARALVSPARHLVVDEPTAHLDAAGANAMLATLATAAQGRGLVVITHATSGLEAFDRVVALADGRATPTAIPPRDRAASANATDAGRGRAPMAALPAGRGV